MPVGNDDNRFQDDCQGRLLLERRLSCSASVSNMLQGAPIDGAFHASGPESPLASVQREAHGPEATRGQFAQGLPPEALTTSLRNSEITEEFSDCRALMVKSVFGGLSGPFS